MKRLKRDTRGAVTVFVTLLLIPAILVSGTAVDIARMYTARSILHDANQMAANSVLTQYNALLYDLYGIFGIAKNDPIFAELLDEYISVTVFGDEERDRGLGTFQLFYGSNPAVDEIYFPNDKNLRNPDVLYRQILEYMKFRGPVIIVKEILDTLGASTFKGDAETIANKLEIDDTIAEIFEKYKELYEAIIIADKCKLVNGGIANVTTGRVSSYLRYLRDEFIKLSECREKWLAEEDADIKADLKAEYNARLVNIVSWTEGGRVGKIWENGAWEGNLSRMQGLERTIELAVEDSNIHKPKFDDVVRIAREIDAMHDKLAQQIEELERRIDNGECNAELRDALTVPDSDTGKSVLDSYKDIIKWDDVEGMAVTYKDGGYGYIDGPLYELLDNIEFRNKDFEDRASVSIEELLEAVSFPRFALESEDNITAELAEYKNLEISYNMPDGFVKFGEYEGDNEDFFKELTDLVNQPDVSLTELYEGQEESDGEDAQEKQENMIDKLLSIVDDAYAGLTNSTLGAKFIDIASADDDDEAEPEASNITQSAQSASSNPVAGVLTDPLGSIAKAGDYLLLLTYCTSMYSNYTTGRPGFNGKTADDIDDLEFSKSITGVPVSPEVNYFFQSEWEYLYYGSPEAGKNLNAVSRLIYLVRVICNYITVFSVSDVTKIVNSIRTAFSWCAPLGVVLGELARAAFVAAESAIDLASLRSGHKVALIKSNNDWICSPKGIVNALNEIMTEAVNDTEGNDNEDEKGLSYSNYLLFFFLAKGLMGQRAVDELLSRTADLIEWNMVNYLQDVRCDEEKMTEALAKPGRFKLADMITDFSVTSTAHMKMLFLSMGIAGGFADSRGIGLPQTLPVTATDYRGY